MKLRVRDAARLLDVSEKTIYRWISERGLPTFRIHGQYRFNQGELLEWATAQRVGVSAEFFTTTAEAPGPMPSLAEALRAGGIHYRVTARDKETTLRAALEQMPLPATVDRAFLFGVLLARESQGSTGIGNGIAIPHVRNPIVLNTPRPQASLCFLERPVEFGAIDGKPVHTVFVLISPTISTHLHLLSKLAFALGQAPFAEAVARRGSPEEILAIAAEIDRSVPRPAEPAEGGSEP